MRNQRRGCLDAELLRNPGYLLESHDSGLIELETLDKDSQAFGHGSCHF